MTNYDEMGIEEKMRRFFTVEMAFSTKRKTKDMRIYHKYADPKDVKYKINADWLKQNAAQDCYREIMVSFLPMVPLLEDTVQFEDADYILYAHPYARCEDASDAVLRQLKFIAENRKKGAQILVVGKAANAEKLLNGSIENITFWHDYYAEELGKKFGFNIKDQYIVYNDYWYDHAKLHPDKKGQLNIWPVNGCNQKCKFCRRSYMYIPFEIIPLEEIKEKLDWYQENYPERMEYVSLRAENLTEYPWLAELIDLLDSYPEIKKIEIPIGMAIGGITKKILRAICRCDKIVEIGLNPETANDRLLKVIGKQHTKKWAMYVFRKIRKAHPDIRIESTIMIGLPTETIEDIYELADFLGKIQLDYIHCNYYIDNPRQPLSKFPQISETLREYHLKILIKQLMANPVTDWSRPFEVQYYAIVRRNSRKYVRLQEKNKYRDFPKHFSTRARCIPREK